MTIRVPRTAIFFALAWIAGCSGGGDADVAGGKDTGGAGSGSAGDISNSIVPLQSDKLTSGTCPYSPAAAVLDHAICVCKNLGHAGRLETRATLGGSANVGANGMFTAATGTTIAGSLVARDQIGISGGLSVREDLATRGDVTGAGEIVVGRDLSSGGNVGVSGSLKVGGALRLGGELIVAGLPEVKSRAPFQPVAEPCGCDGANFFDVAARVGAAKGQNDNAKAGLTESGVLSVGAGELTLPTGNYYLGDITTVGDYRIKIAGAVGLHVDGDLTAVGAQNIELAAGATLDLFVNGNLQSAGDLRLGEGAQAGAYRLYVGGDAVVHAGTQAFHGLLYAPRATVAFSGSTIVYGAVFAKEIDFAGELIVDYRGASAPPPTTCQPEPSPPPPAAGSEPTSSDPPSPK